MSKSLFVRIDLLSPASDRLISEIKSLYAEVVNQNSDKVDYSNLNQFTLLWFVEIQDRWWKMVYVLDKKTRVVTTAVVREVTYGEFQAGMIEEQKFNPGRTEYQTVKYQVDDDDEE